MIKRGSFFETTQEKELPKVLGDEFLRQLQAAIERCVFF